MLLIIMHEWIGPGRRMTQEQRQKTSVRERNIAFATRMKLESALKKINDYQKAYEIHFLFGLSYTLLQISEINNISDKLLEKFDVEIVENLTEDFKNITNRTT